MSETISKTEFELLQKLLDDYSGIFIGEDKSYIIENRVGNLMKKIGIDTYEHLINRIKFENDTLLLDEIINEITINETFWFRDKIPWIIMSDVLLPRYIDEIRTGKRLGVKIWSCACSSGQEPYSIAISIHNYLEKNKITDIGIDKFQIIASDISDNVLKAAVKGVYNLMNMERGLDDYYKNKYFTEKGKTWLLCDEIKNMVKFCKINLKTSGIHLSEIDVVFCKYVLIYFSDITKKAVLNRISSTMNNNGIIFFGSSEIVSNDLIPLTKNIYKDMSYYQINKSI